MWRVSAPRVMNFCNGQVSSGWWKAGTKLISNSLLTTLKAGELYSSCLSRGGLNLWNFQRLEEDFLTYKTRLWCVFGILEAKDITSLHLASNQPDKNYKSFPWVVYLFHSPYLTPAAKYAVDVKHMKSRALHSQCWQAAAPPGHLRSPSKAPGRSTRTECGPEQQKWQLGLPFPKQARSPGCSRNSCNNDPWQWMAQEKSVQRHQIRVPPSPYCACGYAGEASVCKATLNCSQGHNQHTGNGRTAVKYKAPGELGSGLLWECCFWNLQQAQQKSKSKLPKASEPWLCIANSAKD